MRLIRALDMGPTGNGRSPWYECKAVQASETGSLGGLQACEGQPGSGCAWRTFDCVSSRPTFREPLQTLEPAFVRELLSSGLRRVDIPKAEWGDAYRWAYRRWLNCIAQEVARRYLEPIVEPVFHPDS